MNRAETMEYIEKNFDISGEAGRLITNILSYAEGIEDGGKRHRFLCEMLDGTIGLSEREIRQFLS